ncbi:triphosphoribosyl-dephospho-CoA synthase [Mobilicoccus sp.]|uniref:triphosphoribosyl-dephospho-CoA synthase n=1 Tax=Mobilicoccus sp. TaxID=2034349 RepID=UPI0028A0010C|nr:triphosphoribosyl-dephospho-CoA synthase [Mobilicoccus sp.]
MNGRVVSRSVNADLDRLARLVDSALRIEARLTPKPGLVDHRNDGAHIDMDLRTLTASADALGPWWVEFALVGAQHANGNGTGSRPGLGQGDGHGDDDDDDDDARFLADLRAVGRTLEQVMFDATDGVNTHKGAIFAFGLLLGCAGRRLGEGRRIDVGVCDDVGRLATTVLLDDLVASDRAPVTAGERLYREHGLTGARGQAASGYAAAREVGLVAYREALEILNAQPHLALGPMMRDRALLHALLALLSVNSDTNLAHRGGVEAMSWVARRAEAILAQGGALNPDYVRLVESFDDELIHAHLSPGGTADLLAVTVWLSTLPPVQD